MALARRSDVGRAGVAAAMRQRVEVKKTSKSTVVPDNPRARLMYYLNCVISVIDDGDDDDLDTIAIRRLRDYKNYRRLSDDEIDKLVTTCDNLKPSMLLQKGVFVRMSWENSRNEFIKITRTNNHLLMTSNVMIGGVRHSVTEQMQCSQTWLDRYYFEPMQFFRSRLNTIRLQATSRRVVLVVDDCVLM